MTNTTDIVFSASYIVSIQLRKSRPLPPPLVLSNLFGLIIVIENQNVATGWFSFKMFTWIIVV